MELKKLMGHISVIPDYRQAWKVEHKLPDILSVNYLRRYFWCIRLRIFMKGDHSITSIEIG